jgi:hypothetical protein
MDADNPIYTVGSQLRVPFGQRRFEVNAIDTTRQGGIFYCFDIATGDCFRAVKWYSELQMKALNPVVIMLDTRPLVTVLPPPEWSNVLYHPTMLETPATIIPFAEELEALEAAAVIEQDAAYEAELDAMYERLPARACIRRDLRPGDDVYIWSRPFPLGGVWTLVGQVLTPADEDNRVLMRYVSGVPMLFALDAKYKYAVQRNAYQVAWRDCEYHASHPKAAEHRAAQADFNRKLDALLDKAAPIMELIQADVHRRIEEVAFKEVKDMAKGQDAA